MIACYECQKEIEKYPCACGYDPKPPAVSCVRETYRPPPDGITKEEFGVNLYDTITTIGGIMGIDQQRAAAIHTGEGYKVQALLTRRKALQKTLAGQLPELTDDEMDPILAKYPWVTGC